MMIPVIRVANQPTKPKSESYMGSAGVRVTVTNQPKDSISRMRIPPIETTKQLSGYEFNPDALSINRVANQPTNPKNELNVNNISYRVANQPKKDSDSKSRMLWSTMKITRQISDSEFNPNILSVNRVANQPKPNTKPNNVTDINNVTNLSNNQGDVTIHIYESKIQSNLPVLIWFGSTSNFESFANQLNNRGLNVIRIQQQINNVNYLLNYLNTFVYILKQHKFKNNHIYVGGHSINAFISLLIALDANNLNLIDQHSNVSLVSRIKGVVSVAGWFNLDNHINLEPSLDMKHSMTVWENNNYNDEEAIFKLIKSLSSNDISLDKVHKTNLKPKILLIYSSQDTLINASHSLKVVSHLIKLGLNKINIVVDAFDQHNAILVHSKVIDNIYKFIIDENPIILNTNL